jgi:hypothetical protein
MKLVWENLYDKEYAIQVSDGGTTWSQRRYVSSGKGGTEEFLQPRRACALHPHEGVARGTQYGYSLFEVEF